MPTVTARTASELNKAMALCISSSAFGMSIITAAPMSGMKIARLGPQCFRTSSMSVSAFPWSDGEDEGAGQHDRAAEEQRPVLLDAAGLHAAQDLPCALGAHAGAVDSAGDGTLVD